MRLLLLLPCLLVLVAGGIASSAHAHEQPAGGGATAAAPAKDKCKAKKLKHLPKSDICTHGADPSPPGKAIGRDVPPLAASQPDAPASCEGDGVSGPRVEVLYIRASDVPDRYATYVASIRQWAADADAIYQASAAETGGTLGIRYVHTSSCVIGVGSVVLSPTGDDTFDNTISELQGLGYSSTDRKYMLFVDANVYCGIGGIYGDERPGQENWNNQGPSYGRTDAGCWGGHTAAHELMHNLGGIQLGAPNTSGGWHCVDEYDVMCYSDSPNFPTMRIDCADTGHEYRLDCNHDDYFSTSPPAGSYLALNWNAANSRFLTTSVTPPPCLDSATEPDDSAAQARTVAVPSTSSRAFCLAGDGDWVKFSAGAGRTYRLDTLNLAGGTDTVIELYATDGATLLASDDDGGGFPNSLITWTAPTSGTYYLKARQYNGAGSVAQTYDLRVTELDSTAPTVTARSPAANARSVSQSANITATFSEAVQGVASSTFTLRDPGGASVAAVVSRNGTTNQWILNANANLAADTRYTVTLTGGATAIRDQAGNPLATSSWSITTGPAPTVSSSVPAANATGVSASANVTATFSEAVKSVTSTTFTLRNAATSSAVAATVTRNSTTNQYILDPTSNLAADTRYTLTLTGGASAIRDMADNPLVTTSRSFTTGPAPVVIARSPAVNATGVRRTANVTATFSEAVNGVSATTFTLKDPAGASVAAVVSRNGTTNQWILNPNATLLANTRYTVRLTGGTTAIRDLAGNRLSTTSWTYTTGS